MDDTIVVFTSDNGGLSTGDRGISADQGWPTSNAPLRCGKGWLYEGGIRVPLLIKAPCGERGGNISETPASSIDFLPTLCEMAGVKLEHTDTVDGVSLSSALRGESSPQTDDRPLFWHYPHYGNQGGGPGAAIRKGDWKLVEWYESGKTELYNVKDDLGESEELSLQFREIHDSLHQELVEWRKSHNVQMPQPNETFEEKLISATKQKNASYTSVRSTND